LVQCKVDGSHVVVVLVSAGLLGPEEEVALALRGEAELENSGSVALDLPNIR
jgi:hypothetical protein